MNVVHKSDCAVHNMPAYPNGECDCGARPYPVSRMIRDMLHTDGKIECPQEPPAYKHTEQCDRLHDSILHLMHRYGLPPGPPIIHPKDHLTRS